MPFGGGIDGVRAGLAERPGDRRRKDDPARWRSGDRRPARHEQQRAREGDD
jgi:hypothetical protein